jgi:hypothetical protein
MWGCGDVGLPFLGIIADEVIHLPGKLVQANDLRMRIRSHEVETQARLAELLVQLLDPRHRSQRWGRTSGGNSHSKHGVGGCEEESRASSTRQELHAGIALASVCLDAQGQGAGVGFKLSNGGRSSSAANRVDGVGGDTDRGEDEHHYWDKR